MEVIHATPVNILGGSLFGILLAALCFGALTIQTSSYYCAFPNDGRPVKLVVGVLWTLQAFQLACSAQSLYWWSVKNYNNPLALKWGTWEFSMHQINIVCSSVTVQTFFAHRVYSLSANLYVGVLVQVLVLLQLGFGTATSVKANMHLELQVIVKESKWLFVSWLAIQAATDIVIAIWMCLLLRRRRTGFQKTDSVINRMVLYTISPGLVTSVLSCIDLVLFAKYGFQFGVIVICMTLGPFYSITMLINLHTRKTLQARLSTPSLFERNSMKKIIRENAEGHGRGGSRLQA
ncbi:hypothetical protein BS47DRAFT_842223 [Hydnum rufescens UP504]|uniref:DUF6534 domain-containing protein n=1 Tax=Hydnum rufescens UP504 TaxID=1448309 RepID=A0A9P6AZM9_9AGAM|nr:hypothetical protein BS47DRAFT_842223 [Hydnum rufescens UP504]